MSDGETTLDLGELVRDASASFDAADAARVTALDTLATLHTARGYMLQRRRNDLAKALGEQAPAVKALDAEIAASAETVRGFTAQAELAATPLPTAEDKEAVVYGFVRDAAGKGLARVKVTLVDKEGNVKATALTRDDGSYELRHDVGEREAVKLAVRIEHAEAPDAIPVEVGKGGVAFVPVRTKAAGRAPVR